jgi:hypothetical protein
MLKLGDTHMAKFGLLVPNIRRPQQVYEGDYMHRDGEYVTIYKNPRNDGETAREVAAIRLDKGQSVREIEASEAASAS